MSLSKEEIIRISCAAYLTDPVVPFRAMTDDALVAFFNTAYAAGAAAEREAALTKKYVPMTDAEWAETMREFNAPASSMNPYDADYGHHEERYIEAAVIRRAGLEVQG